MENLPFFSKALAVDRFFGNKRLQSFRHNLENRRFFCHLTLFKAAWSAEKMS